MSEFPARHPVPPRVPGRARVPVAVATATLAIATVLVAVTPSSAIDSWEDVEVGRSGELWWKGNALALDNGKPRAVYTMPGEGLLLAWCDAACDEASGWRHASVLPERDPDGGAYFLAELEVDEASGRLHIAYADDVDDTIGHLSCAIAGTGVTCTLPTTLTAYDPGTHGGGIERIPELSLAVNNDGLPALAYSKPVAPDGLELHYHACTALPCTTAAQWSDFTFFGVSGPPRLAFDGAKPRIAHQTYTTPGRLLYATCDGDCFNEASWHRNVVYENLDSDTSSPRLVLDGGRPRVLTVGIGGRLLYLACDAGCGDMARWTATPILVQPEVDFGSERINASELAVGSGTVHAVALRGNTDPTDENGLVEHLSCATSCSDVANWSSRTVGSTGVRDNPETPSLALDGRDARLLYTHYDTRAVGGPLHYACEKTCEPSTPMPTTTTTAITTTSTTTTAVTTTTTTTTTATTPTTTVAHAATPAPAPTTTVTTAAPQPSPPRQQPEAQRAPRAGHWLVGTDGGVFAAGDAAFLGSTGATRLNQPIVGMAATPTGKGYWFVARDGGIFAFGDAPFLGSTGALKLNQPIVGMAATPSGKGYWLVARDGGIFAFGDAPFLGSTGAIKLNQPIVGMAATPTGKGYWLVARDGGIFAFGDAPFLGSTGAIKLNQPIVGMAARPQGDGYWFVAADGGVFTFGAARYHGSASSASAAAPAPAPVVGMAATPAGGGYTLAAADGTTYAFGDAPAFPPPPDRPAHAVVGIAAVR